MLPLKAVTFLARHWLYHWLHAVDEHSLQSPAIYEFYTSVVKDKNQSTLSRVESVRKNLLNHDGTVELVDPGAGSQVIPKDIRKIRDIARSSTSKVQFSILLRNTIAHYGFKDILELGTSFGINTMYLASGDQTNVHTIEGSPQIAAVAKKNFLETGFTNITLHEGNIDEVLPALLSNLKQIDLAYLDANHTYEATLRYFEIILPKLHADSIVFVDDIYWSPGMKKAWKALVEHPSVKMSADIFDAGILFFKEGLQKANYLLAF